MQRSQKGLRAGRYAYLDLDPRGPNLYIFFNFRVESHDLEAKLSSRDQVGGYRSVPEDQNPAIQWSLAVPRQAT